MHRWINTIMVVAGIVLGIFGYFQAQEEIQILKNQAEEQMEAIVQIEEVEFVPFRPSSGAPGQVKSIIWIHLRNVGSRKATHVGFEQMRIWIGKAPLDDMKTVQARWDSRDLRRGLKPGEFVKLGWTPDTAADPKDYFCNQGHVTDVKVAVEWRGNREILKSARKAYKIRCVERVDGGIQFLSDEVHWDAPVGP